MNRCAQVQSLLPARSTSSVTGDLWKAHRAETAKGQVRFLGGTRMTTSPVGEPAITSSCRDEVRGSTPLRGAEWAAGVLEGEGSFLLHRGVNPRVSAQMTDLDVLQELQRIFGGSIYKTSRQKPHHRQAWAWMVMDATQAVEVMRRVRPFMLGRRGERIDRCLAVFDGRQCQLRDERVRREHRAVRVRRMVAGGVSVTEVARGLGISRSLASQIVNGAIAAK